MADRNYIVGPAQASIPVLTLNGVPLIVIADLPEGGFISIISGDNPIGIPTPGPQIGKGAMLVCIPADIATQLRPEFKKSEKVAQSMTRGAILPGRFTIADAGPLGRDGDG